MIMSRAPATWNCAVCHRNMHAKDREAHLAGKSHRDGASTTKKAKSKGGSSKFTPTEDEFTREDGLFLLREIDTGFGCRPGGGAYKESNKYYGPGIYDYY
jgi:hypothetical protein